METGVIKYISETFELDIADVSEERLKQLLSEKINSLVLHDFSSLVQILYRIDVSEQKLKSVLKENPGSDAGEIIAGLVIERQLQKIRSRQQSRDNKNNIDEAESW